MSSSGASPSVAGSSGSATGGGSGGEGAPPVTVATSSSAAATPPAAGTSPPPPPPKHPVQQCCDKVFDAFKENNFCETLASYEELQTHDLESVREDRALFREVTTSWGRAMMAAWRMSGDEEHVAEMISDFEARFGFVSPYLVAILVDAPTLPEALEAFVANNPVPPVPPEAVEALLDKHRGATPAEVRTFVELMKKFDIPIEGDVSEKLQKMFVMRMRAEDPEEVLAEMLALGVKPTQPHAYNFVFMKQNLSDGHDVMSYYEQMLDFGIRPHESTLRILAKKATIGREDAAMFRRRVRGDNSVDDRYVQRIRRLQAEGEEEKATQLYERMLLEGVVPDRQLLTSIILTCKRRPDRIEHWYQEMLRHNIQPNTATFTSIISTLRDAKEVDGADRWIDEMQRQGVELDLQNYAAMIDSYVKAGQRAKAMHALKSVMERGDANVAVYNSAMRLGPFDFALGCLACLLSEGLQPTSPTRSTMHHLARDEISLDILTAIGECEWAKDRILRSEALVAPPRGTYPSLLEAMRLLMREMKLSASAIERRTSRLHKEIADARLASPAAPVTSTSTSASGGGGGGGGGRRHNHHK